jgi:CHAT domain-containing protein
MGGSSCEDLRRYYNAKHEQARNIPPDYYHLQMDYATFEVTDCGWRSELQKEVEADLQRRDPVGTLMPLVIKRAEAGLSNSELFARNDAAQRASSSLLMFFDMADGLHLGALLDAWSLRMLEFTRREPAAAGYAPMANAMRASALVALERPQEALDVLAASGLGRARLDQQPLLLMQSARAQLGDARASLVAAEQQQIRTERAEQQSSGVVIGAAATAERAALDARQAQGSTLSADEAARLMQLRRSAVEQTSDAARLPTADEILAAIGTIPERTTVLIYRWDGGALDVWRAEQGKPLGLKRLKLMSSQTIRRLSDDLHTALATQAANWFEYSFRLYEELLKPLDNLPDGHRLVIVGSIVENVPFELLGPDPQHLLFTSHPVTYARSVWAGAREARSGPAGGPLVVGLDGPSLSSAETEANLVAIEMQGSKTLIGADEVTKARVIQTLPSASWVHLATHATLLPNRYLSSLALAKGEDIEGWMLFELAASADTVVLSACDTSIEITDNTLSTGGLSAVLLAGGARRIVATRWEANDGSTTEFMQAFYHALGTERLGVDRALQSAQRAVAVQHPHPYFFANFSIRTFDLKSALQEGGLASR